MVITMMRMCDHRSLKKLLILGLCVTSILIIANIDDDDDADGYAPTEALFDEPHGYSTITPILREYYNLRQLQQNAEENIPQSPAWYENMTLIMEKRKQELEKNCHIFGLSTPGNDSLHKPNEWEFLINRPHRLVWCNVFKAASTSWMYNFNILAGYSPMFLQKTKQVPLQLARRKYPRPSLSGLQKALNDSTSFLIVRHPLERLLSGYRDKIEYALPNTYHYKMGSSIISKFRVKDRNRRRVATNRPLFSEFVLYLFDLHKNQMPFDMHWAPITEFCTPCQIRFDIIMKFETLQDDQNYLIQTRKLQKWIKPQWKNPSKGKTNTTDLIQRYYSQLTTQQIEHLYMIYRYDFQLFGYSLDNYIKFGTPS